MRQSFYILVVVGLLVTWGVYVEGCVCGGGWVYIVEPLCSGNVGHETILIKGV